MSWSDDTRCLFCEGRLPLYRKITHGQFCSSAHRKSYWQEQERLAIERLSQTHSSLRSYRATGLPELQPEPQQETVVHPQLETVAQTVAATAHALETEFEPDQAPKIDVDLYPLPDMGEPPAQASELLGLLANDFRGVSGSSPELIAADPFEYEISIQPLPPTAAARIATRPLPEGASASVWSYLGPRAPKPREAGATASLESGIEVRQPQSRQSVLAIPPAEAVEFAASKLTEYGQRAVHTESDLHILEMEPAPVTSLELNVSLQNDVLVQMLDQQVPQPDRMHSLAQFAAHMPPFVVACEPTRPYELVAAPALPNAGTPVSSECRLHSRTQMLELSRGVTGALGSFVTRGMIAEIELNPRLRTSAALSVVNAVHEIGTVGLLSLVTNVPLPAQGAYTLHSADAAWFDFSTGVSSDIAYPRMVQVAASSETPLFSSLLSLTFARKRKFAGDVPRIEPIVRLIPETVESHPIIPSSRLEPLDRKPAEDALRAQAGGIGSLLRGDAVKNLLPAWAQASGFWQHAPRDLKILLFAIPALLALVFHPGWPRVAFAAPQSSSGFTGNFKRVLNTEWGSVRQTLENRAAVALDEDFRSGLDNWASPGGSTAEWSFDATGFVRPGPLALYRPSVNLTDYHAEFVGLIDKKALSWVVRAADFENFYVIKLAVVKPGPMPTIGLTRYAVIHGKSQDRHDVNIPISARMDTVYNVRMDVQGSNFSVEVQGQMADSWTETRLPRGGIGFFTANGEASRLRWMQITHQYDMLGRLCAYLAPYDTTNGSWQP